MEKKILLKATGISKQFPGVKALKNVDFEVYEGDAPDIKQLKSQTQARFEVAVFLYYQKQFEEAHQIFEELLQINPQDKAAMLYVKRCQQYQQYGVPEGWEGVTDLDFK